jgi:hypothetical protein
MKFALTQTMSVEVHSTTKGQEMTELSNKMKNYFKPLNYGESIEEYLIGVICIHPGFDPFFKIHKPSYIENKKTKVEGIDMHIYKSFGFDIKLNFQSFISTEKEEERLKMIAAEIMKTLYNLKYPKKVTDFNKDAFLEDIKSFFKQMNLI